MSDFVRDSFSHNSPLGWTTNHTWVQRAALRSILKVSSAAGVRLATRLSFRQARLTTMFANVFAGPAKTAEFVIDTTSSVTFMPRRMALAARIPLKPSGAALGQPREYSGRFPVCQDITLYFTLGHAPIPIVVYVPIDPDADRYVFPRFGVAGLLDRMMFTASVSEVNVFLKRPAM